MDSRRVKRLSFLREWHKRWAMDTPSFFKKVARLGNVFMAGSGVIVLPGLVPIGITIPQLLFTPATYIFIAGAVMLAVGKAGVANPIIDPAIEIDESEKEKVKEAENENA